MTGTVDVREFAAWQPDDSAKQVLELVHAGCGQVLCDIEPDDTLEVLVSVATNHMCTVERGGPGAG